MAHATPLPYRRSSVWIVVGDHAHVRTYAREPRNIVVSHNAREADEILTWSLREVPGLAMDGHDGSLPLEMADRLNRAHGEGRFDGVIIIAPPGWLGEIRPHLKAAVRDAVMSEVGKDLTKLPRGKLLQKVGDLLLSRDGAPA